MSYSSFENDKLEPADKLRIDRKIYFEQSKADISELTALPLEELRAMREESATAEQAVFERLQQQSKEWEEQAGKTLLIDKAIEYARTPEAQHTSNQWEQPDEYRHVMSNMVYRMQYSISENTRYDREKQKSIPYSWTLSWSIYTNSPDGYNGAKIAGQSRKVFGTKEEMEKYLNGRIKAYKNLFTEISPPIPQEYAEHFKVNGLLLPGYTIEGETLTEQKEPPVKASPPQQKPTPEKKEEATPEQEAAQQEPQPEAPPQPRPVNPIILTADKPAEKIKEITDRLEQGITELFDSERYKEYLQVMSKFHNYSFNNTLLIAMQKPDASLIAGFNAWKNNFGRNVMRGEKGIRILAPSPYKIRQEVEKKDPQTGKTVTDSNGKPVMETKEIQIPAYKVVAVFDVSQTEGRKLPAIGANELTGDVEQYEDFFAALEKTSPVPMGFEKIEGTAHGYYHLEEKRIAIDEGMSQLQNLKTAIHEIAHAKLHDIDLNAPEQPDRPDRRTREVQAESIAYTVCQHYGLDTSDYSFGYVAGWSSGRELAELKTSLETIRATAAEIINSIDGHFAELTKQREAQKAQGAEKEPTAAPEQPQEETQGAEPGNAATPEIFYKVRKNPYSDSPENSYLLQEYVAQDNGMAKLGDILYTGTPEKCRELLGKLEAGELTQGDVKELYAKAQEAQPTAEPGQEMPEPTAAEKEPDKDTFTIYQLKDGDGMRDYHFEPYDRLQAAGLSVEAANYNLIYTAELTPGTSLEDIYTRFNIDHPKDFRGHSLSVSDIVVLHQNGEDTAHYVDSFGYKEVPEFLQEQTPQLIPDTRMTGEQIRTPRGSFSVTDMTAEQMREAGYGLHHTSEDGKYLIMGNGTQAFAVAAEQPEKVNPLKHVEDTIEQNDNNFDGIINNTPTPTADELEAKARSGEQISLAEYAAALKAEKEQGKKAEPGKKPEKKPSIRAQLRADKERAAQKKQTRSKSQDLERS